MINFVYKNFLRPIFFMQDPEIVHDRAISMGGLYGKFWLTKKFFSLFFNYQNPKLKTQIKGITFQNPVGLAAGFDKNACLTQILPSIGFGFEEIGSISGTACQGNPKPRLKRLVKDQAIIVNYGLCNIGAENIAKELINKELKFPVGINIARANNPDIVMDVDKGIQDYLKAYNALKDISDYFTINISCPNTPADQAFSEPENFSRLIKAFPKISKPVFIKLKPDMSKGDIDKFIEICDEHKFVTGFIISNLTKDRSKLNETSDFKGGISGLPTKQRSNEMIKYVYQKTQGRYIIIGCGGIFSAEDAYEKIKSGASLVQLVTGMIYEGPGLISDINKGLVKLMERDGYSSIGEAVGKLC